MFPMMRIAQRQRISRIILPASVILASAIVTIVAFTLWQAREDARTRALREGENIVQAIEAHVARNIELYDLSLQGLQEALATEAVARVGQEVQRLALFDRAASAKYMGALYVLNAAGEIVICSRSTTADPRLNLLDLTDRDYFQVHQYRPDIGLYISRPFKGRLERREDRIALSRRLADKDGKFAGIVVGTLRLSYFRDLFSRLNVGRHGLITLARSDGTILMRHPSTEGAYDIGGSFKGTPIFERILRERSGSFTARSLINGVNRLFTFRQIGELPLFVAVDQAVDDIFAEWWHRAIAIGSVTLTLAVTIIALAVMFRSAQRELAAVAVTDGLTGLANRRCFDQTLQLEWQRAARTDTRLALLMIDVDNFKTFNDQHGHWKADEVLKAFGEILKNCSARPGDLAARYGGEEFAVILPNTDTTLASVVAERIRVSMMEREQNVDSPTVSIGVASVRPRPDRNAVALIKAADTALYRAKANGRNRFETLIAAGGADLHALPD
jgi:diguanylate cyclase (GGDEF)-like protein